jgi:radical SAM protein with 4Fe4S-binding SPASM domain
MPARRDIRPDEVGRVVPIYGVWELTLRCDHACSHCGSRAGAARAVELSPAQAQDIAHQLADLGLREVTLIGGEAYLRPDCADVIRTLTQRGLRVSMQTGGRGLTRRRLAPLVDAGLAAIGVSIDGMEAEHDHLRASPGSFRAALGALDAAREAGIGITSNTQINRLNRHVLPELRDVLREAGVRVWRWQLTVPMGRAADHPEWILQPWMIPGLVALLARLQVEEAERAREAGLPPTRAMNIIAGNNVGYYGPDEVIARSRPGRSATAWQGCKAGIHTLGLESDGTLKGCPSLPTAPYAGGNVLDLSVQELWDHAAEIAFARDRTTDELWGFCRTCDYAEMCRGGCSFTAHCVMGRRGNNPLCAHRALSLARRGIRERLVLVEAPGGDPYDFGRFTIVEEPLPDFEGAPA